MSACQIVGDHDPAPDATGLSGVARDYANRFAAASRVQEQVQVRRPLIPRLSNRLDALHGMVELDLAIGTTGDIIHRAEALDLDLIGAFHVPRLSRLVVVQSGECHFGAVCAPSLGLECTGSLPLAQALRHPLCLRSSAISMTTRRLAEMPSKRVTRAST